MSEDQATVEDLARERADELAEQLVAWLHANT